MIDAGANQTPDSGTDCEYDAIAVSAYYDEFSSRLLGDYALGNKRIEAAIEFVVSNIPCSVERVLDIGFGIGWSAQEIARHFPRVQVDGFDLSGENVRLATELHGNERVRFWQRDLTAWDAEEDEKYDAIVMIDVYEHVLADARAVFHGALARNLAEDGILILTCPSEKHQDWLRQHNPGGLQPVDEDITEEVVAELAEDLGRRLLEFRPMSVWRSGDYNHILIGRQPLNLPPSRIQLLPQAAREQAVRELCGLRVHSRQLISEIRPDQPRVCVAHTSIDAYSQTFVRPHVSVLEFDVITLHGQAFDRSEREFFLSGVFRRGVGKIVRWFNDESWEDWATRLRARWLIRNRIDCVLAEFGTTGVGLLDSCRAANIPLVVHFHGYDAHRGDVRERARYDELFAYSSAIIVVSSFMRSTLISLGAEKEKLHYLPCSIDTQRFHGAKPWKAPIVFLAVGRFVEKKAPHLTILAFSQLLESVSEARLELVGDGDLLGPCESLTKALKIDHAVTFHGVQSNSWISQRMRCSRAFVQHSVRARSGDCEGTPVAVLEAQASGLPVVATRHAGIQEAVVDGETGLLCDEGDIDGMAANLIRIVHMSEAELMAMSRAAASHAKSNFSRKESMRKLARIIVDAFHQ